MQSNTLCVVFFIQANIQCKVTHLELYVSAFNPIRNHVDTQLICFAGYVLGTFCPD